MVPIRAANVREASKGWYVVDNTFTCNLKRKRNEILCNWHYFRCTKSTKFQIALVKPKIELCLRQSQSYGNKISKWDLEPLAVHIQGFTKHKSNPTAIRRSWAFNDATTLVDVRHHNSRILSKNSMLKMLRQRTRVLITTQLQTTWNYLIIRSASKYQIVFQVGASSADTSFKS